MPPTKLSPHDSANKKIFWVVTSIAALLAIILPTLDDNSSNRFNDSVSFRGPSSSASASPVNIPSQNNPSSFSKIQRSHRLRSSVLNNRDIQQPDPEYNNEFLNEHIDE